MLGLTPTPESGETMGDLRLGSMEVITPQKSWKVWAWLQWAKEKTESGGRECGLPF